MHTLVLNADYSLLEVISWKKAIEKIISGKVELLEAYAGRFVRSPSVQFPLPAVVRLVGKFVRRRVRLSRRNVLARDNYTCQYCGARPRKDSGGPLMEALTIDHVVPRAHALKGHVTLPWSGAHVRVTSWENLLTSCAPCNSAKGARTPGQVGFTMARLPRAPNTRDIAWMGVARYCAPDEWAYWLP